MTQTKLAHFIAIEGPDASGKSDVLVALKDRLSHRFGVDCFKTPSFDGPIGRLIRKAFDKKVTIEPHAMMHLFNADAIDQEAYMRAQLALGRHVLLDRHTRISGCVYQLDWHPLHVLLNNLPLSLFKRVDACVLLDAPAEVLAQRIRSRFKKQTDSLYTSDAIERIETIRQRYRLAPVLHHDLVKQWLHFDTSDPNNTPEHIARTVAVALDL